MKKKFLNRFLAFMLSVLLLSVSAGDAFISVNDISVSQAVVPAVIGYDVMYEMCRYIGSVYLGYTSTREMPEVNIHNDDVARIGYNVIKGMYEHGVFNPAIPLPDEFKPNVFTGVVDSFGQQYVFGSEAYKDVAETEFTVIQGGKNDGDGDDDDDDDDKDENNIIHFPKKIGETAKLWFALSVGAAADVIDFISKDYQSWINGEPDTILGEWLNSFNDTFSDYESIQNADGTYSISGYESYSVVNMGIFVNRIYSGTSSEKVAAVQSSTGSYQLYSFNVIGNEVYKNSFRLSYDQYQDGKFLTRSSASAIGLVNGPSVSGYSYGLNVPIFASMEAAEAAFVVNDFSDAMNYAKVYRIADWLADDEYWNAQHLIDPLTGLNALSNWYNIVRHQGLNALGNELSADDFAEYLRDYFANLGTDIFPEVDPSQAPIKYPSTVEDVVIDPAANPSVYPAAGSNPGTNPGTDPGTNPDGNPGTNPGTETDPDDEKDPVPGVVDIPIEDIVPTVSDSFFDVAGSMRYKFPFSIPWDIHYMLSCLAETPKAPRFELPLVVERYNIHEKIIIDMEMFQTLSELSRSFFSMLFAIFLVNLTFKVVGMRKEE